MDEGALALEGEEWEQEVGEPAERCRPSLGAGEGAGEREAWDGVLTLQLSADGAPESAGPGRGERGGRGGSQRPAPRRATAADKELAQARHRTHLLCLLARALALDQATTSPLLQAALLSIVPLNLQPPPPSAAGAVGLGHAAGDPQGDEADRDTLLRLSAWFRKTFTLRPVAPSNGSKGDEEMPATADALLAALERRGGTAEEVGALSVALLRALGLASRLVVMLDPLPLKPDAAFLEDSSPATPAGASRRSLRPRAQVPMHEKSFLGAGCSPLEAVGVSSPYPSRAAGGASYQKEEPSNLAHVQDKGQAAAPEQALGEGKSSPGLESAGMRRARGGRQPRTRKGGEIARARNGEDRGGDGAAPSCPGDAAAGTGSPARQSEVSRQGAAREGAEGDLSISAESPDVLGTGASSASKKRRGDEEFELQIALAVAATARAEREGPSEAATAGAQAVSTKTRRIVGSSSHRAAAIWSQEFGNVSHWAEVYCRESRSRRPSAQARAGPSPGVAASAAPSMATRSGAACASVLVGRWVHWDAARGVVDGADKVEGLVAGQGQGLRYVVACAGGGAKDVTKRYAALWSRVASLRDEDWWQATLAPLLRLEAQAGIREQDAAEPGLEAPRCPQHVSGLPFSESKAGGVPLQSYPRNAELQAEAREEAEPEAAAAAEAAAETEGEAEAEAVDVQPDLVRALALSLSANKEHVMGRGEEGWGDGGLPAPAIPTSRSLERASLEDMELDIKTLTEPLPTSQQAYRTHPLYVLERWLGKYQALHPRGPVLGLCGGQPVFPRTCVKQLHTRRRWLAEGRSVKEGEQRFKVVEDRRGQNGTPKGGPGTRPRKNARATASGERPPWGGENSGRERIGLRENSLGENGGEREDGGRGQGSPGVRLLELFGEWQTEAYEPPLAKDGRVPKNEWGQVDVWSEAMLPGGTVHLRYPGIAGVAHRLGFDFAPAMVGFEVRAGQPMPKVEGIVVCVEHAEAILDAFLEEERARHEAKLRRRRHAALLRWRDLLQALLLRQELKERYESETSKAAFERPASNRAAERGHGKRTIDRLQKEAGPAAPPGYGILADSLKTTSGGRPVEGGAKFAAEALCPNGDKDGAFVALSATTTETEPEMDSLGVHMPTSTIGVQEIGNTTNEHHVHEFKDCEPERSSAMRTRECKCGFRIEVEEM